MTESLILKKADVNLLAVELAEVVAKRLEPLLIAKQRRLVDRPTMADLANVGTATLDRLVAARRVPSILIGTRRLFDPDLVLDALAQEGGASNPR